MKPYTRILLATIAGTITYLSIGYLVFELLLGDFTTQHTTDLPGFRKSAEEASLGFLILSCAAYALLVSLVLHWSNAKTLFQSFQLSATIGLLVAIMADCYWYSYSHYYNNLLPLVADVLAAGLTVGLMGVVVGWVRTRSI